MLLPQTKIDPLLGHRGSELLIILEQLVKLANPMSSSRVLLEEGEKKHVELENCQVYTRKGGIIMQELLLEALAIRLGMARGIGYPCLIQSQQSCARGELEALSKLYGALRT